MFPGMKRFTAACWRRPGSGPEGHTMNAIGKTELSDASGAWPACLLLAGAFLSFFAFAAVSSAKPFTSDEYWLVLWARDYAVSGSLPLDALMHPPLYSSLNAALFYFFKEPSALKIFGAVIGAGSMVLMYLLGLAAGAGKLRASLAVLLLGLSPLFIQASLLLDTDNTLVTFFLLAMLLSLLRQRWGLLCGMFLLCLWSKLTACLPILLVLSGWALWALSRGEKRGWSVLAALFAGAGLFLLSFFVYCSVTGLPFAKPFIYVYRAFFCRISGEPGLPRQALQLCLWSGPAFCLLWLAAAARALGRGKPDLDLLAALLSAAIGLGYVFVGGAPFGFPKYQVPAFVLGCWLVSGLVKEAFEGTGCGPLHIALLLAGTGLAVAAGDPIYTLRFVVREALAAGQSAGGALKQLAVQVSLPLLTGAAVWFLTASRGKNTLHRVAAAIAVVCFAQFAGEDILQLKGHNTIYTYGSTGTSEAVRLSGAALEKGGKGAFPPEIAVYLRLAGFDQGPGENAFWSDAAAIRAAALDPDYKIVMYGTPFNTLAQLGVLNSSGTVSAFSGAGWRRTSAGSYQVWLRPKEKR